MADTAQTPQSSPQGDGPGAFSEIIEIIKGLWPFSKQDSAAPINVQAATITAPVTDEQVTKETQSTVNDLRSQHKVETEVSDDDMSEQEEVPIATTPTVEAKPVPPELVEEKPAPVVETAAKPSETENPAPEEPKPVRPASQDPPVQPPVA